MYPKYVFDCMMNVDTTWRFYNNFGKVYNKGSFRKILCWKKDGYGRRRLGEQERDVSVWRRRKCWDAKITNI